MQMQVNNFLEKLREETADSHTALEQNERSSRLMSPQVTLTDYTVYLERMYGFIRGFERYVFPRLTEMVPDLHEREKSKSLIEDLHQLQVEIDRLPLAPEEVFQNLYPSVPAAMAGLYVVEGSTLGGVIINKHIHQVFGNDARAIGKYFSVYDTETGTRWKAFLKHLIEVAETSGQEKEMIEAAKQTFSFLELWMSESIA